MAVSPSGCCTRGGDQRTQLHSGRRLAPNPEGLFRKMEIDKVTLNFMLTAVKKKKKKERKRSRVNVELQPPPPRSRLARLTPQTSECENGAE